MNRPAFLTAPAAWTRVARQTPDPIRYAAAIEGAAHRTPWQWHDFTVAVIAVGSIAAMIFGSI